MKAAAPAAAGPGRATVILLLLLLLTIAAVPAVAAPSQRGKCALECYSKCLQAGTPSAVYCNCPVQKAFRQCESIEENLNTAPIASLSDASTEYLDAHSIRVRMAPVSGAFIYIFEYATISTAADQWLFAGASSSPSISFTVLDPCRDYQFRVLAVVRPSTVGQNDVIIYRALPIRVQLPPFVLHTDQISIETPVWNASDDQVKCDRVPEDQLPTPKIEIIRNGGRLAVWLPASILDDRCRLWVEVRMLPRCVRLEPFSVQKALELDCSRTPELAVCQRGSMNEQPECTDVIDVWGRAGEATLMWQPPASRRPLAYAVRIGRATVQGTTPLVTWRLSQIRSIEVAGNETSLSVPVDQNVDYGVQVCALFSASRSPKFDLVKVTPFTCRPCIAQDTSEKCGECSKIEMTTAAAGAPPPPSQHLSSATRHTVFSMDADMEVAGERKHHLRNVTAKTRGTPPRANGDKLSQPDTTAISIDRRSSSSGGEGQGLEAATQITSPDTAMQNRMGIVVHDIGEPESSEMTSTAASSEEAFDQTTFEQIISTLSAEGADGLFDTTEESTPERKGISTGTSSNSPLADSSVGNDSEDEQSNRGSKLFQSISIRPSEEPASQDLTTTSTVSFETTTVAEMTTTTKPRSRLEESIPPPTTPPAECYLSNGVRCLSGCELPDYDDPTPRLATTTDRDSEPLPKERCLCSRPLFHRPDGACGSSKPACVRKSMINATWDPSTQSLMFAENMWDPGANRLFVEVGLTRVGRRVAFIEPRRLRQKTVVPTQPFRPLGISIHVHLNSSLSPHADYGVRVCHFRDGTIAGPLTHDWDALGDDRVAPVSQLVAASSSTPARVQSDAFEAGGSSGLGGLGPPPPHQPAPSPARPESYWAAAFTVGKISILVALISFNFPVLIMAALVYVNCSRLRTFYDRKRTHYFRPFIIGDAAREQQQRGRFSSTLAGMVTTNVGGGGGEPPGYPPKRSLPRL